MRIQYMLLILFSGNFVAVHSANILGIFVYPSKSHMILASALLKQLVARGHNVTLFSPFIYENAPVNFTNVVVKATHDAFKEETITLFDNPQYPVLYKVYKLMELLHDYMTSILKSEEFNMLLNQKNKFDLIIQHWAFNEPMLVMGYKHKAPTIGFCMYGAETYVSSIYNNPMPFAYVPNKLLPLTDDMSFSQRISNTILGIFSQLMYCIYNIPYQEKMLRTLFPDAPPLQELIDNVDITFVNSHELFESAKPLLPNLIQIGGFHLHAKEILPSGIQVFLDNSNEGVIYCNFGTNINTTTFSPVAVASIKEALSTLKYNVLGKLEGDWPNKPKHILTYNWLPQRAILAHKNVKVFITHGGLGGIMEALYNGVPMIAMPVFFDQNKNVVDIVNRGYGIGLDHHNITPEKLINAVVQIMNNPNYSMNVKKISEMFQNQPLNQMDKAVYWIEHVLRYKTVKYLKSRGSSIPWYQYLLLDVFGFLIFVLISCMYLIYVIHKYLKNIILCRPKEKIM